MDYESKEDTHCFCNMNGISGEGGIVCMDCGWIKARKISTHDLYECPKCKKVIPSYKIHNESG